MNLFAEKLCWNTPPDRVSILDNEVHIWLADTCHQPEVISFFKSLLSHEEKIKAERFVSEADRLRFVIGKGGLKNILSRYLNIKQEEIDFIFNEFGKPFLPDKYNKEKLNFNLSHFWKFDTLLCSKE